MNFLFFIVLQALDNLGSDNREFYHNTLPIPEYLKDSEQYLDNYFVLFHVHLVSYIRFIVFLLQELPLQISNPQ